MKYVLATLLLITLVGAAAPPKQDVPPPWDHVFVTGYISTENNLQLFGGGRKQIYLRQIVSYGTNWEKLAFASDADYRTALLNDGQLVLIKAHVIYDGNEDHLVPITIQLKTN